MRISFARRKGRTLFGRLRMGATGSLLTSEQSKVTKMVIQSKTTIKPLICYEVESSLFFIEAIYEGSAFRDCWIRSKGSEITHSLRFSNHMQLMVFVSAINALEEELTKR